MNKVKGGKGGKEQGRRIMQSAQKSERASKQEQAVNAHAGTMEAKTKEEKKGK
jgi:hypothetical protein